MKILIDTREQVPLEFTHEYVTGTIRRKLDVGDYSVEYKDGSVPSVVFERKSLGDLFGTMGKGYPRFRKELLRAQESDTKLILIVEATKAQVLRGYKHSRMKGLTVYRKLLTLWIKYGLVPMFCKDRAEMAHTICEYYGSLGRLKARGG